MTDPNKTWEQDSITYNAGELLKYGYLDSEELWNEFKEAITKFTHHFFMDSFIDSRNS